MAKERIYPFAVASVRCMENKLLTEAKAAADGRG